MSVRFSDLAIDDERNLDVATCSTFMPAPPGAGAGKRNTVRSWERCCFTFTGKA